MSSLIFPQILYVYAFPNTYCYFFCIIHIFIFKRSFSFSNSFFINIIHTYMSSFLSLKHLISLQLFVMVLFPCFLFTVSSFGLFSLIFFMLNVSLKCHLMNPWPKLIFKSKNFVWLFYNMHTYAFGSLVQGPQIIISKDYVF